MKADTKYRNWLMTFAKSSQRLLIFTAFFALAVMLYGANLAFGDNQPDRLAHRTTALLTNTLPDRSQDQLRALEATYFADPTGAVDLASIPTQRFIEVSQKGIFPVPSEGAVWLRFTVSNPDDAIQRRLIGMVELFVHELALYAQRPDGLHLVSRNGRSVPLQERAINVLQPAVPLQIRANETQTFYLRVSGMLSPAVSLVVISTDLFTRWSTSSGIGFAALAIFAAMMAVFSLIFFRQVDPRSYQFYAAYMTSRFVFAVFYSDWFVQWSGIILSPTVSMRLVQMLAGTGTLLLILFCRALLSAEGASRRQERVFQWLLIAGLAVITATILSPQLLRTPLFLFNVAAPFVMLVLAISKYRAGLHYAGWVAVGLAALMLGMSFAVLGFLFPNEITPTSSIAELRLMSPLKFGYHFAILSEPIFMMIALSRMVNSIQEQKYAAIQQSSALQQKVETVEIEHGALRKRADARIKALETALVESPDNTLLPPAEQRFLERATECVLEHVGDENFGVRELAFALATSEKTLRRRMQKSYGQTSVAFIRSIRLSFARDLIMMRQHRTIAEVAHASGFSSVSHFTKLYRQEFNETPGETYKLIVSSSENEKLGLR